MADTRKVDGKVFQIVGPETAKLVAMPAVLYLNQTDTHCVVNLLVYVNMELTSISSSDYN